MNLKLTAYKNTEITKSGYLGIWEPIPIPRADNDPLFVITTVYTYRPDLLAYDLYRKKELWWIFAQRNPDTLKDPVFDFIAGTEIYLPQGKYITQYMGI